MAQLSCPRCGYTANFLCNLHTHFERRNPCKPKIADIPFKELYQIYYKKTNETIDFNVDNIKTENQETGSIDKNGKKDILVMYVENITNIDNHCIFIRKMCMVKLSPKKEIKELKKQVKELLKFKEEFQSTSEQQVIFN